MYRDSRENVIFHCILLQEPPRGVPEFFLDYRIVCNKENGLEPRAAIMIRLGTPFRMIKNVRDAVVVSINESATLASVYLHPIGDVAADCNLIPTVGKTVTGCDCNSHSLLWGQLGHRRAVQRGRILEDYLVTNCMEIHNVGGVKYMGIQTGGKVLGACLSGTLST